MHDVGTERGRCECLSVWILCVSWDASWLRLPGPHQTGSAYLARHQIPETHKFKLLLSNFIRKRGSRKSTFTQLYDCRSVVVYVFVALIRMRLALILLIFQWAAPCIRGAFAGGSPEEHAAFPDRSERFVHRLKLTSAAEKRSRCCHTRLKYLDAFCLFMEKEQNLPVTPLEWLFQGTCRIPWAQWGIARPSAAAAALRTATNPEILNHCFIYSCLFLFFTTDLN